MTLQSLLPACCRSYSTEEDTDLEEGLELGGMPFPLEELDDLRMDQVLCAPCCSSVVAPALACYCLLLSVFLFLLLILLLILDPALDPNLTLDPATTCCCLFS